MKPFNLELAKAGHPVCTRDGESAKIICFDRKSTKYPIIALIDKGKEEIITSYNLSGQVNNDIFHNHDLFMKPEKKEGWINVYFLNDGGNTCFGIYDTKEDALSHKCADGYIDTIKIEWEE